MWRGIVVEDVHQTSVDIAEVAIVIPQKTEVRVQSTVTGGNNVNCSAAIKGYLVDNSVLPPASDDVIG